MVVSAIILLALLAFSAFAVYLNGWDEGQPIEVIQPKSVVTNRMKIDQAIENLDRCSYYDKAMVKDMKHRLYEKRRALNKKELDSPYVCVLK